MRQFLWAICSFVLLAGFGVLGQQWTIDTSTTATTLVGVGTDGRNFAVAAAAENNVGAVVESYNGTKWTKTQVPSGLLMDSAISANGLVVASGMWNIFVSTDSGATYNSAVGVNGLSQSASIFGTNSNSIGLVGSFVVAGPGKVPLSLSGVAVSRDSGNTWTTSAVPVGYTRYGAFPSDQTWYVSSGMWADSASEDFLPVSSRMQINKKTQKMEFDNKVRSSKKTPVGTTGWFGAVSKTSDGGKTWTQVFASDPENDYYYFNGISCSSDSHCVVVGEGQDAAGAALGVAFTTTDGGASWTQSLTTNDVSMMGVDFVSEDEAWVAATQMQGRNLVAQFYHTLDGGKTFKVEQTLTNCFALDVDFAKDATGVAGCASSSGSSCFAALYR